jgi:predicted phosphodiesterase
MSNPRLSPELAREALRAVRDHRTVLEAARALGLSYGTLRSRVDAARSLGITADSEIDEPSTPPPPSSLREPLTSFEEAWQQWKRAIGMAKDRYVGPPSRHAESLGKRARGRKSIGVSDDGGPASSTQKILVVPDLHAPFHEPEMFAEMLRAEKDADHCICIGDMGDAYALSRFVKYEHMPYRDEWAAVTLVMQELATRFQKVTIILGNHDVRLERQIRDRLTEDMVDAIKFITGGILCPITALAKRYPNVTVARHETPAGHTIDWFATVGDAWLGHPEKYSRVPGAALRFTEEWLADNEKALGLDRYRLIVMGHTHAASIIPWRAETLLVECGCLCRHQGYMTSARIGGRPQRRGYVTFTQNDGVTDLNSVRFRWLDVAAVA